MKSKLQALVLLSISLSAAFTFAPSGDAQTHRASLLGTVYDLNRAVVPGAAVKANLNLPDNFLGSPTFGQVTSARDPRHIQFGAKLLF